MEQVINKWKLNKSLLAQKMNMPLGTFCNKLSSKHSTEFSDSELVQLKMVLKELTEDVSGVIDIDFNEALSVLVKKSVPPPPADRILKEGGPTPSPKYLDYGDGKIIN